MPEADFVITFRPASEEEERTAVEGLTEHTREAQCPAYDRKPFSLLAYAQDGLAGSLIGQVFWNWLYVDLLWVHPDYRNWRLGSRLMNQAEQKAREMNLTGIYCWTQSWQAAGFYRKLGYEQFAVFEDFPPGHRRHGLRKYLNAAPAA